MTKHSKPVVIITTIYLLLVIFSCQSQNPNHTESESKPEIAAIQSSAANVDKHKLGKVLNIYYFHTLHRCHSCTTIEKLTKEAVQQTFSEDIKAGAIKFNVINVEKESNKHFVEDYKIYTKSVIISEVIDGTEKRWKNLDKVWTLLRNPEKFKHYIIAEINTFKKS